MRTILGDRPTFDRNNIFELMGAEEATKGQTYAVAIGLTVVASVTKDIDWSAYVLDREHDDGVQYALDHGDKLPEAAARALFPGVEERYRR